MPIFEKRSVYPVSVEELFAWHARPGALQRMTPPWEAVRVLSDTGGIQVGARIDLAMRIGPVPVRWLALHDRYEENREFRDIQLRGPFTRWEHTHHFEAVPDGAALTDRVEYELPLPPFGGWFGGAFTRTKLERTFHYRHALLGFDLERHARYRAQGARRFVVSGGEGVVGTALRAFLSTGGHTVVRLSDGAQREELGSADGVIHLGGDQAAAEDTQWLSGLSEMLAGMTRKPAVLIVVGDLRSYGERGDEGSSADSGVARAREAATTPAEAAGIRVVHLRTGADLTPDGGPLGRISLEDLLGVILFAAFTDSLAGPINVGAREAVQARGFSFRSPELEAALRSGLGK